MWYSPNPGGYQSIYDPMFESKDLNNEMFDHFTSLMELGDVVCDECEERGTEEINELVREQRKDDTTSRLIMTYGCPKKEKPTKMQSLLIHMRNSVAHGRFTLTADSTFIGFDCWQRNYTFFLRVNSRHILNVLLSINGKEDVPSPTEHSTRGWYMVDIISSALFVNGEYEIISNSSFGTVAEGKIATDMTVRHIKSGREYRLDIKVSDVLPRTDGSGVKDCIRPEKMITGPVYAIILCIPNRDYVESTVERLNKIGYVLLDKSRLKGTFSGKDMLSNQLDRL